MKIRIVIPTRNRLRLLKRCIQSIRSHSEDPEIIVIDNGSTDHTAKIALEVNHYVRNGQNIFYSAACNQGASLPGVFDAVCFLNDDTTVRDRWLELLVAILESESDVSAVQPMILYPDGRIQSAGMVTYRNPAERDYADDGFYYRNRFKQRPSHLAAANVKRYAQCLTAACLLVRREAFEEVGGFDQAYKMGHEDVDFCFKLLTSGWKLVYEPASTVIHHEGVVNGKRAIERTQHERQNMLLCKQRWNDKIEPEFETLQDAENDECQHNSAA